MDIVRYYLKKGIFVLVSFFGRAKFLFLQRCIFHMINIGESNGENIEQATKTRSLLF